MKRSAEEQLAEEQMGFRQKVGTRDQMFSVRILMEKAREFNVPLYIAFVDFKKAFDSVRHTLLWNTMKKMGVSDSITGLLRRLYNDQEAAVRVEGALTDWFPVNKGVRQGCLVSPLCFNLYSEEVMRRSADELQTVGVKVNGRFQNNLRYADDIALISTTPEGTGTCIQMKYMYLIYSIFGKLDRYDSLFSWYQNTCMRLKLRLQSL